MAILSVPNPEEIIKKRAKRLLQACLENPELNEHVIINFLHRNVQWDTIIGFAHLGKPVKCELCNEDSVTGFWCSPCIHPNWCCYCCILLGFFRYG